MSISKRAVQVYQVPARSAGTTHEGFLRYKQLCSETQRPRLVLDCSTIWDMDTSMIQLLLSYLEEVMRYNGDVRLAGLSPQAEWALRFAKVSRLFEIYATTESAVQSFHQRATSIVPFAYDTEVFDSAVEYATAT
jgi:anti-anti-sigma factor